jgi:LCP family protein required for cell wall assembly
MPKLRKKSAPKRFDVHRTLPNPNTTSLAPDAEFHLRTDEGETQGKKRGLTRKKALLIFFLLLLIPALVIGVWDFINYSRASQKMFGSSYLLTALPPNSLDSQSGRTNLLLAGFSKDDPNHAGAELTDSIMLLSLDKETDTGYMLSVPRDLYVEIPGYGHAKINEAYQAGQQQEFSESGYPKGGMGLLQKVVSENFDIPIHYHALINYGAVKDTVKALDGITVDIKSDDPRGIYDPGFLAREGSRLKLKNGKQKINAQTALNLTRARGLASGAYGLSQSDFDRTNNQQTVIKGIKEKITWQRLLDPRKNAPLLDAIASNVKTDLKLSNIPPLYGLFSSVPGNKLKSIGLRDVNGQNMLASYSTPSGQSALIPATGVDDFSQIQEAIKRLNK